MSQGDEIRPLLPAYLDGELNTADRQRVQQHLVGCEDCSRELRTMEESAALLEQLADAEPPSTLATGLRQRMRRRASGLIVFIVLALIMVLPVGAIGQIVLRNDLPLWARAGFGVSTVCFGIALAILLVYLLRQLRNIVIFAFLSGETR